MSSIADELDRLNRIHDDEPQAVADGLLRLEAAQLSADQLRTYAFLVNHVLGEKLGRWTEAVATLAPLSARPDAPLAVLRQYAVAARQAGDTVQAGSAVGALAARAGVSEAHAQLAVDVATLAMLPNPAEDLARLAETARQAPSNAPSTLDESLAVSFNNVTTSLYYATRTQPLTPALRAAMVAGADAALVFWLRAGGWMQHERAHYLCAKVALRVGEPVAAIAHAERGLAIVAANGADPVEKAFLLQLLVAAVERAGNTARAQALRGECEALDSGLDDDLRKMLAEDREVIGSALAGLQLAFIGGGNMATALISGLLRGGVAAASIRVVEPVAERRAQLEREFGVGTLAAPDASLRSAQLVVLAVKPQQMKEACEALQPRLGPSALIVSVAAGIRARDISRWVGTGAVVRAMPNTPALIGLGITGLAALSDVGAAQRRQAEALLQAAGEVVWVDDEALLDPVTGVSGSGPAYVFFFIEALIQAGRELGFAEAQARQLAIATFAGAAQLAAQSSDPVSLLRERVTSKGGTTAAALARLDAGKVREAIVQAVHAASARAKEMADQFGQ